MSFVRNTGFLQSSFCIYEVKKRLGKTVFLAFNSCIMSKLIDIFTLIGFSAVATFIHLLGHTIAARLVGLKIEKFTLFFIPVLKFQTPLFPVEIGILPLGGSVKLPDSFEKLSLPLKWLLTISGPLLLAISAVIVLPFDKAVAAFVSGFGQIIYGAISPVTYGAPLFQKFFAQDLATSVFTAYGIFAMKVTANNLLPLVTLNGGQLITAMIPNFSDSKWGRRLGGVSMLITLAIFISWGIAFAVYLFR
jgi:membrane-associated protease RseP (regulator of RpoE activity)